jgi:hypothetical protein
MEKSLLDLYTNYLISSFGPTTATGLGRLVEDEISHDQVTRFLTSAPKTSADLWRQAKPLLRQVESPDGVLIIADSIQEKPYTDENELICWHWDHSQDRAVKGIQFLTAFYATTQLKLPLAFDLVTKTETYVDPKTGKTNRRSSLSKNERARMRLHICVHNQVQFTYVPSDLWCASADNYEVHSPRFAQTFRPTNRKVALSRADQQRGQYVAISTLDLPVDTTREIWLEEVDFPLLLTNSSLD